MRVYDLRTNHLISPENITKEPEFSWKIESNDRNVFQTAYQISVTADGKPVWSTDRIESETQAFIDYEGPLKSRTVYEWNVTVWDNKGNTAMASSSFETAFLSNDEWKALWIESPFKRNKEKYFTYGIENPVLLFEKRFALSKPVKRARLYATSFGAYRVIVNGKRPDNREFAPEFTPYAKILNYQTYDVTSVLTEENEVSFLVGNGWFFTAQTEVIVPEQHDAPAILYQFEIEYDTGEKCTIFSDGTETVRETNIIFSDLFQGERVDLTKDFGHPEKVLIKNYNKEILRAQPIPPISAVEVLPAKSIANMQNGDFIVDFGQVIAGRARICFTTEYGKEVIFDYTEVLDKDGNYFSTMNTIKQRDVVVSNGVYTEYEPLFTFHGFRYIKVTGIDNPKPEDFKAVLLSTPKENTGDFTCDHKGLSQLYRNIRYSQKNNMMSIPTDCPSREKAGWTGDILLYSETAALNEEVTAFLTSWLYGLKADQKENGVIPMISPYTKLYETVARGRMKDFGDTEIQSIAGWSDALVWVPYSMYKVTGNTKILEECFPAIIKLCNNIEINAQKTGGIWNSGFQFGEWLIPGLPEEGFEACRISSAYTTPYFGYKLFALVSEICTVLGKDNSHYKSIADNMKKIIVKELFENDALPKDLQGAYVLAFAFGLVPEKYHEEYKNRLIKLVESRNNTLGTGFLATPFVLSVLDSLGRHDLAMKVLLNENQPSWLFEVNHGATTIWESWMGLDEENNPKKTSYDHYAFGVVDSYIAHSICGINGDPGYRNIVISPRKEESIGDFKRVFVIPAGEVSVERKGEILTVIIPPNTRAKIIWNNVEENFGSGTYTIGG